MTKRLLPIIALLLMVATGAWAQTYTVTFKANNKTVTKEVTLPYTFSCNYSYENGELDEIIKSLYSLNVYDGGFCTVDNFPSATGSDAVTAGNNDGDQYITINAPFAGTVTVTGKYNKYNWEWDDEEGFDVINEEEFDYSLEITCPAPDQTLDENTDNSSWLQANNGAVYDITLGRTLKADGWNSFAVPFSTAIPSGWTVKQLASSSLSGDLLTLNFEDATSIAAGTPYLVKVNAEVVNPTFDGVTITDDFYPVEKNDVTFFPILDPTPVSAALGEYILFIQDGHTLTWAKNGGTIKGFRALFILKDVSAARSFEMNFGDETTGIKTIGNASLTENSSAVYDLQGRRIATPTRGLYIVNGKKVAIK